MTMTLSDRMKWFLSWCVLCLWSSLASAQSKPGKITYDEHVVPILREKCFACHNPDKKSGGLVLNNFTALMEGSSSGKIVAPGNPDGSPLFQVVTHQQQPYMPPKSPKLPPEQLEIIKHWIAGGGLENAGSKAIVMNKPKVDFALTSASLGKPEGPPPMPPKLPLEPVVRTAKANALTALATSPCAPLLAVGGQKQILLYHSETLELLGVLPFPEGVPHVLKFSRNGSLLLAGGGRAAKEGKVVVFSVTTGERLFQVGDELDTVLAADISSDQTRIALGGPSKVVRLYSTKDGQLLQEIKKHTDWIYALEFSPDGVLLATADRNGGVFVWEAHTAREHLSLRGHTAAIMDLSWRADSNVLATGSEDSTIRLWEMENGGQIKNWGAHGGGVQSVEFTRDGRIASCGRDRVAKVWDPNGAQQRAFEAFPDVALRVTFSQDGSRVIAGDWTGQIRVWQTADGKHVGDLLANPPTLAERLEAAQKELAARKAAHDQLAAAAAGSQAVADKTAAELAAAQQAVADVAGTAKATTDALVKTKAAADQAAAHLTAAQGVVADKDAAAKLLAEAAAKTHEAAAKLKGDKEVMDFATRSKELAARAARESAGAQKAVADLGMAAKTANEQFAAAQQAAAKATVDAAAAPKLVEARQAAAKVAADKAAADKAALAPAAAALAAAQAQVDKWTAARPSGKPR